VTAKPRKRESEVIKQADKQLGNKQASKQASAQTNKETMKLAGKQTNGRQAGSVSSMYNIFVANKLISS